PTIINMSRKKRIAAGSGRDLQEVNRLIKQFEQMQTMMKQFSGMMKGKKGNKFKLPFM
ncbi:MAG: signal recognition particle protein, partial [Niameybacter sp.]